MADVAINRTNLIAQKFFTKVKEYWPRLTPADRPQWISVALALAMKAWEVAAANTDQPAPSGLDAFKFVIQADNDQDGIPESVTVYSPTMYYAKLDRKCKSTWDPIVIKQLLELFKNIYELQERGSL